MEDIRERTEFSELEKKLMREVTQTANYKEIAYALWDILDNIDSASDMFKPCEQNGISSYNNFYKYALNRAAKRFNFLKSDGYKLYTIDEFEKRPKEKVEYLTDSEMLMSYNCNPE